MKSWEPSLGATLTPQGVQFRLWAPAAKQVELVLEAPRQEKVPMTRDADGYFSTLISKLGAGALYRYRVDGKGPFPDPVSRFQPTGIHGVSMVVEAESFAWTDKGWKGVAAKDLVIYELHVGAFTPEGTFAAATQRLRDLKALGITAIELLPVADFPGKRNWGYDGVALFAPARCYGTPDDLRRLVNEAHGLELAVLMDVVYNHLGPDGNYTGIYSDQYFTTRHRSPWGAGVNLDGPGAHEVRHFFIENARHWIHEYHMDGLRLDATHAIIDESPKHFLEELTESLHATVPERTLVIIAEDHRNLDHMVVPRKQQGWGLDGVWADDFHHQMRRLLAGDHESYYQDFRGTTKDLAETLQRGWFFTGQPSKNLNELRGTQPDHLPYSAFVICLQNHDQIGNRPKGDRLHHAISPAAYRAASAVLLCAPETPLLFMGQEWAATSPFIFFTDHEPELGEKVTQGRREEFKNFSAFRDSAMREQIPDPQAAASFERSQLRWDERDKAPHAGILAFYKRMLDVRKTERALRDLERRHVHAGALDEETIALLRQTPQAEAILLVARLKGKGRFHWPKEWKEILSRYRWELMLHSEQTEFAADAAAMSIELKGEAPAGEFQRPGALLLKGRLGGSRGE